MGNSKSNYERHEDDNKQPRRVRIGKEFRLILGQVDLSKEKKVSLKTNKHRKLSSSSSNSTIASSSSIDLQNSFVSLIQFDIPTSPFDSNEVDMQTLIQYLTHQQSTGKELSHLFQIPTSTNRKSQTKLIPTLQIATVYYNQTFITSDLNMERLSVLDENEIEQKLEEFYEKNILSIYPSKSMLYIIYTKKLSIQNKYHLIRSTVEPKSALKDLEWLQPFLDYSKLGYRLCGLIPFDHTSIEPCFTIYWLFEQIESNETLSYDYCVLEYPFKTFSLNRWISLLDLLSKQEWKLVATLNSDQRKGNGEQLYFLLFFQRLTNQQD